MTSRKVMLSAVVLLVCGGGLGGCSIPEWMKSPAPALAAPYPTRHVWAVAPLHNESGSLQADGLVLADHLQRQLENAANLDVLPVNRTLAAIEATGLRQLSTPPQALALMRTLGCDGLVVGTITAYDPYDPPKLGLALELYTNEQVDRFDAGQLRRLTTAEAESSTAGPGPGRRQPASIVAAVLDAADPRTRELLEAYGVKRGPQTEPEAWRRYRISMDLYCEFAAYVMSWRLLEAERQRLAPPPTTQPSR